MTETTSEHAPAPPRPLPPLRPAGPGLIPIVVINLDRAPDRLAFMTGHLGGLGLDFARFEAWDGRADPGPLASRMQPHPLAVEYGRALTEGEIGCAASFQDVMAGIAAGSEPFVCVLEDDARCDDDLAAHLERDWLAGLPDFDVLRLQTAVRPSPGIVRGHHGRHVLYAPLRSDYGMTAQIVSRAGAARIARGLSPLRLTVDVLVYRDPGLRLRILELRPGLAWPNGMESTIGTAQYVRPDGRRPPLAAAGRALRLAWRKLDAVAAYAAAWGPAALFRLRSPPPGATHR